MEHHHVWNYMETLEAMGSSALVLALEPLGNSMVTEGRFDSLNNS